MIVIAEKPKVAYKIAQALGQPMRFLTGWRVGDTKVLPAAGHLFNLMTNVRGYPVFDYFWAPERAKSKFIGAFRRLPEEDVVIACDFDIEGSLIGYNVVRFALSFKPRVLERMKFSSMVLSELRQAFKNRLPVDMENVAAGEARHEVDYLFGINLSRFLIDLFRKRLSAGRVQIPTLGLVIKREEERAAFVPKVYYIVEAEAKGWKFIHPKKFGSLKEAKAHLPKPSGVVRIEAQAKRVRPPPPYNLSDLQKDAAKLGISPAQTLRIAQRLYEEGLISYPRTTSRRYPKGLPFLQIAARFADYKAPLHRPLRVIEGKETDAHPCIYPTGKRARLDKQAWKVFDLIVRRFLATLSEDALVEHLKLRLLAGEEYLSEAKRILKPGWTALYPKEEKTVPFVDGESVQVSGKARRKKTSPPPLFSKIQLLAEMERRGLGTKATRAEIIEKIFRREYVKGRKITSTPLGRRVYEILSAAVPEIVSEEMTADLEKKIEAIREDPALKSAVVREAKERIAEVMERLIEKKETLRKQLMAQR